MWVRPIPCLALAVLSCSPLVLTCKIERKRSCRKKYKTESPCCLLTTLHFLSYFKRFLRKLFFSVKSLRRKYLIEVSRFVQQISLNRMLASFLYLFSFVFLALLVRQFNFLYQRSIVTQLLCLFDSFMFIL